MVKYISHKAFDQFVISDATNVEAPNIPSEETCANEYLCAWCKKLFSSPVGRMRHSMHCNWNPDRINSECNFRT